MSEEFHRIRGDCTLPCGHRLAFRPKDWASSPTELAHEKSPALIEHYNELFQGAYRTFAPNRIMEIGVHQGGSVALWEAAFGCHVVGIDRSLDQLSPACRAHFDDHSHAELHEITVPDNATAKLGSFDLIIDDGSHGHQVVRATLETLWHSLHPGGLYIIEDWRQARFHPERLLQHLGSWLIGNALLEYAEGIVPAKMVVYRGLIAIEKVKIACFQPSLDPTL